MADGAAPFVGNVEVEQALLGALLVNNDVASLCTGLRREDFADPVHGAIYGMMMSEIAAGRLATPPLLKPKADLIEGLQQLGGARYLATLAAAAVSIRMSGDYVATIRDASRRRAVIEACEAARQIAADPERSPDEAMASIESAALLMADDAGGDGGSVFKAMSGFLLPLLRARADGTSLSGLTSGLPSVDAITGGWRPGQMIVLAGRPGMGKSTVALQFARAAALAGVGAHIQSLEMSHAELGARQIAMETWARTGRWVEYQRIATGEFEDDEGRLLLESTQAVEAMPMRLGSSRARSLGAIAAEARRSAKLFEAQGKPLGLILIDHLGFVEPPRQRQSKVHEVGDISRGVKQLARSMDVPVILLSQLNRQVESREDKRPILSDLRDSGDIEQDADKVIFAFRDEYYVRRMKPPKGKELDEKSAEAWQARMDAAENKLDLIVEKNRMGRCGSTTLFCAIGINAITELANG